MNVAAFYRDPEAVSRLAGEIAALVAHPWKLMEVCGGQTHAIAKYGLEELLPPEIELIHGPGCPVCVTSVGLIDLAVELAGKPGMILGSYGDMLRVPGSRGDLLSARARGADVRMFYAPMDAVLTARDNPDRQVVFFAVGFETTAPASALAVKMAARMGLDNFSLLVAHVAAPPAMKMLLESPDARPDAFLAPGHVCAVTGEREYAELAVRYHVPVAVTGFEPVDLMAGILACVRQLEQGEARVDNTYARAVRPEGNPSALELMRDVFSPVDRLWRGLGVIPGGGMDLSESYAAFDARKKFSLALPALSEVHLECRAGDVLRGILKPDCCPAFGVRCRPESPLGAPMVSGEGACTAYYRYKMNR